jgi:hypothetical protein
MKRKAILTVALACFANAGMAATSSVLVRIDDAGSTSSDTAFNRTAILRSITAGLARAGIESKFVEDGAQGSNYIYVGINKAYVPQLNDIRMASVEVEVRADRGGDVAVCGGTSLIWQAPNLVKFTNAMTNAVGNIISKCR